MYFFRLSPFLLMCNEWPSDEPGSPWPHMTTVEYLSVFRCLVRTFSPDSTFAQHMEKHLLLTTVVLFLFLGRTDDRISENIMFTKRTSKFLDEMVKMYGSGLKTLVDPEGDGEDLKWLKDQDLKRMIEKREMEKEIEKQERSKD